MTKKEQLETAQPFDDDLPGCGQFYCVETARYFVDQKALDDHKKSRAYKRRVKELKEETPFTQKDAEAAAGMTKERLPSAAESRAKAEAKKGRRVATVYEDPSVNAPPKAAMPRLFQTHSHELWVTGTGFARGTTEFTFANGLKANEDYVLTVFNRTHALVTLLDGKKWGDAGALSISNTKFSMLSRSFSRQGSRFGAADSCSALLARLNLSRGSLFKWSSSTRSSSLTTSPSQAAPRRLTPRPFRHKAWARLRRSAAGPHSVSCAPGSHTYRQKKTSFKALRSSFCRRCTYAS